MGKLYTSCHFWHFLEPKTANLAIFEIEIANLAITTDNPFSKGHWVQKWACCSQKCGLYPHARFPEQLVPTGHAWAYSGIPGHAQRVQSRTCSSSESSKVRFRFLKVQFRSKKLGIFLNLLGMPGHAWACLGIPGMPRGFKLEHVQVWKALSFSLVPKNMENFLVYIFLSGNFRRNSRNLYRFEKILIS